MRLAYGSVLLLSGALACQLEGASNPAPRCTTDEPCADALVCYRGYCVEDEASSSEERATERDAALASAADGASLAADAAGPSATHARVDASATASEQAGPEQQTPPADMESDDQTDATDTQQTRDAAAAPTRDEPRDAGAESAVDSGTARPATAADAGMGPPPPPPPDRGPGLLPIPLPPLFPPPPPPA